MNFQTKNPEWKAPGTEPSVSFKEQGFKPGYRPPAGYFNWFWKNVSDNIEEIKTNLLNFEPGIPEGTVVDKAKIAETAEKLKNALIVRLNGGQAEGSTQFTFDGSGGKTVNVTPDKIGAMAKSAYDKDGDGVVDDAKNGLWLYKATFQVDGWVSQSGYYSQAATASAEDGGPAMSGNTQLGGALTRPTGVKETDNILRNSLNVINSGTAVPGSGIVTVKVWEKPQSDIDVYWYGRK